MNKIDELMAQVNDLLFAPNHLRKKKSQELRTALEAALKPGADMCERICLAIEAADAKSMREADYMLDSDDCIRIVREHFAAAPPAQTPVEKS
jgi:hypothetical protein